MVGHIETVDIVASNGQLGNLTRRGIQLIEEDVVATLGTEIDHAVGL